MPTCRPTRSDVNAPLVVRLFGFSKSLPSGSSFTAAAHTLLQLWLGFMLGWHVCALGRVAEEPPRWVVVVGSADAFRCMCVPILILHMHPALKGPVCVEDSLESATLKTDSLLIHLI